MSASCSLPGMPADLLRERASEKTAFVSRQSAEPPAPHRTRAPTASSIAILSAIPVLPRPRPAQHAIAVPDLCLGTDEQKFKGLFYLLTHLLIIGVSQPFRRVLTKNSLLKTSLCFAYKRGTIRNRGFGGFIPAATRELRD